MGSWVPAVRRRLAARSGGGLDRRGRRRSFLAGSFSVLTVPPRNGWRRSGSPAVRSGWGCRRVSRGGREAAAGIGRKPHPARSNGGTKVNLETAAESCWTVGSGESVTNIPLQNLNRMVTSCGRVLSACIIFAQILFNPKICMNYLVRFEF